MNENLINHCKAYPKLQPQDVFKYIFHSAFGCEHLVSDENTALEYIRREYENVSKTEKPHTEPLDGDYSRVYLSWMNVGLKMQTLARLFVLSSKKEPDGSTLLEEEIENAKKLAEEGKFPFGCECFRESLEEWCGKGCPAVHHSQTFREQYKPSYRVIANKYASFMSAFAKIDKLSDKETVVVAIEGGSASGKTTLAEILQQVYDCNVFHMDDFFLRPEQRSPSRLAEIGGNVDRERFAEEIILPLLKKETVKYRPFDCSARALGEVVTVTPKKITIIEGVYSTHPAFSKYYDFSVFLDIDSEKQKERVLNRNGEKLAKRFFDEWIPFENKYFSGTDIKKRSDLIFNV